MSRAMGKSKLSLECETFNVEKNRRVSGIWAPYWQSHSKQVSAHPNSSISLKIVDL